MSAESSSGSRLPRSLPIALYSGLAAGSAQVLSRAWPMSGAQQIFLAHFMIWSLTLIHCLSVKDGSLCRHGSKSQWLILILLFPALGAILYLLIGRPVTSQTV